MTIKLSPSPQLQRQPQQHQQQQQQQSSQRMMGDRTAAPPYYPALHALRAACALHAVLALLHPSSSPLALTVPLQLPTLLFLSGFALALRPRRPLPARHPRSFYVRRYAKLFPPFAFATLAHAAFFATSFAPLRRALLHLVALSPYLPPPLVFPATDAPLPLPNLLPALALCYLVFPTVQLMLPRTDTPYRRHHHVVLLVLYAVTALNAAWLASLSHPRPPSLPDVTAFVPFLAPVPPFLLGVAVAHARPPQAAAGPAPPLVHRAARLMGALALLMLSFGAAVALRSAPKLVPGFLAHWPATGLFLPAVALAADAAVAMTHPGDNNRIDSYTNRPPSAPRALSRIFSTIAAADLSIFCVAPLALRALSVAICGPDASPSSSSSPSSLFCLPPAPAQVTALPTFGADLLAPVTIAGPHVTPLFVPVAVVLALVAHFALLQPATALLRLALDKVWSSAPLVAPTVQRDDSRFARVCKTVLYYATGLAFLFAVFRLSLPFAATLVKPPLNFWCALARHPEECQAALQPRPSVLGQIVAVVRWVALLTLPPMLINLVGHFAFPRSVWERMPTVAQTLAAAEEDHKTNRAEEGILQHSSSASSSSSSSSSSFSPPRSPSPRGAAPMNKTFPTRDDDVSGETFDFGRVSADFVLYIRYVTRGTSPRLVKQNAALAAETLADAGLPAGMWRVEVVTDVSIGLDDVDLGDGAGGLSSVYEIVVPSGYRTRSGALFKARALNYAIEKSPAREHDWIVHLDEETRFDVDTVRAMVLHCGRESFKWRVSKETLWPKIGQGPILYGRIGTAAAVAAPRATKMARDDVDDDGIEDTKSEKKQKKKKVKSGEYDECKVVKCNGNLGGSGDGGGGMNWVTTLADSGRVADDMGRYRVQYECGEVWVGMHGSFVVACNAVERAVTFDHGVEGSIAEDAFFALEARARGVRFAWVDAAMFEQSPFTVRDFVRQRARWLVGGMLVATCRRLPLRVRWVMLTLTTLWALMPMVYVALAASVLGGGGGGGGRGGDEEEEEEERGGFNSRADEVFHVVTALLATGTLWNYVVGFFATLRRESVGAVRWGVLLFAQVALAPVFGAMEVMAVTYALYNFRQVAVGFHVVQKDPAEAAEHGADGGVGVGVGVGQEEREEESDGGGGVEGTTPDAYDEETPLLVRR